MRCTRKPGSDKPDELPLVVVAKRENVSRIYAVDAKGERLGLFPGLSLADARARVPAMHVVEVDEASDIALLESIADWCDRFTPLVALDPPFGVLLDISGCAHLFGGERGMLDTITERLRRQGFTIHAAIAGTAVAAKTLTRVGQYKIVSMGEEEKVISSLPVASLESDPAIIAALKRAGLKTIGDLASRNRKELAARFGGAFVLRLDQALGKADEPISPRRHPPEYIAEKRFAEPISTQDVIERAISSLAVTLCEIMEEQGKGARALEASFFRVDGAVRRVFVETGNALKDTNTILRLFREKLNALADPLDPGYGFDLMRIAALHVENFYYEALSFHAGDQAEHEISALVDRMSARYGANRVVKFQAQDTHIPEQAVRAISAQRQIMPKEWERVREEGDPPRRPLRLFTHPELLQHVVAEVPDGPPTRFVWRRAMHLVARADGPERIMMKWWRSHRTELTRDYFRVEDKEGNRFWIYREGLYARETNNPRWFMQGLFA